MTRGEKVVYFTCGQELAKGFTQAIKHPCTGVLENCIVIQLFCTRIYSLLHDMVDRFDMDKLFSRKQTVSITAPPTTGNNINLASIATSISSISSKNTAQLADNDKEETINYNNMLQDVRDQCSLKNNPSKIIAKSYLVDFSKKTDTRHRWCTTTLEFC